ncbi:MAG TPA: hypothetical protein VF584_23985 [Longimicrobium sp.]|jgi:hypothetical protein
MMIRKNLAAIASCAAWRSSTPGPAVRYAGGIEAISAVPGGDAALQARLRAILCRALRSRPSCA